MPEFENRNFEANASFEIVDGFKTSLTKMREPMIWESSDGEYVYYAESLEGDIDYPELDTITVGDFLHRYNMWELMRMTRPDLNGEMHVSLYSVFAGLFAKVTEHTMSADLFPDKIGTDEFRDAFLDEQEIQAQLGLTEAQLQDYANIDNALFDLKPIAKARFNDYIQARLNMTEDEKRWERMQKFQWLIPEGLDKTTGPRWWAFSEGSQLFAVYAASPDEGAIIREDELGFPMFPFVFADELPDEIQHRFNEEFEDRKVVRLIPFSNTEWPKDPENMTDEQRQAFDDLNRD